MKTKLLFLLKLLIISIVLFVLQGWLEKGYQFILLVICSLLLSGQATVNLAYDSLIRIIPFLALMLATPKIPVARRMVVSGIGLAVFVAIDVASIIAWQDTPTAESTVAHLIFSQIWKTTGQWILPFLLWFIAVYKDIGDLFMPREGGDKK